MSRLELTEKVCEQKVKNLEMQMNLLLQRNQHLPGNDDKQNDSKTK